MMRWNGSRICKKRVTEKAMARKEDLLRKAKKLIPELKKTRVWPTRTVVPEKDKDGFRAAEAKK